MVRFPVGAGCFSLHHRVQNGSGAHPASYPVCTKGLSLWVKSPGREADHSPPSSAEVKECVELYFHSHYTPSWRGAQLQKINHRNLTTYLLTYLLTYSLTSWCRILFEKLIVTQLIKKYPAFFMETEGSSPFSQKPVTGPYPEPAFSSVLFWTTRQRYYMHSATSQRCCGSRKPSGGNIVACSERERERVILLHDKDQHHITSVTTQLMDQPPCPSTTQRGSFTSSNHRRSTPMENTCSLMMKLRVEGHLWVRPLSSDYFFFSIITNGICLIPSGD
jgi:hypothetical protein